MVSLTLVDDVSTLGDYSSKSPEESIKVIFIRGRHMRTISNVANDELVQVSTKHQTKRSKTTTAKLP